MMVKFVNRITGNAMWVADNRVDEYKAAGHKLAAMPSTSVPEAEPSVAPVQPEKKKKTAKK